MSTRSVRFNRQSAFAVVERFARRGNDIRGVAWVQSPNAAEKEGIGHFVVLMNVTEDFEAYTFDPDNAIVGRIELRSKKRCSVPKPSTTVAAPE